ncbi:MAG: ACP S-malonyltransferase [Betaproteobacteria bacterium]|nr:ACP S-malonyltransferase [Betaproteobacteria bacterium]
MRHLAFVFPGQGSQSVGMMQGYGASCVQDAFAEASEVLGYDLAALVAEGPAESLNQTAHTQPAMLAAGVAVWRAWQALGGREPALMAGHSLGEYTALVAAGVLSFADALVLVQARARLMQEAVPEGTGAMAAILGLEDEVVRAVCREAADSEILEAVNFNSPGQVVIAGHRAAVERGMALAKAKGAKRALLLPVSVPSHCALMRPAAAALRERLSATPFSAPRIPVLHNADVAAHGDVEAIRDALSRQLYSPVRWVETIRAMGSSGITHVAECGPGKVLAGLNKRIEGTMETFALTDDTQLGQLSGLAS